MMWHMALLGLLSVLNTQSPATLQTTSQSTLATATPPLYWLGETPAVAANPAGGNPLVTSSGVASSVKTKSFTTGPAPAAIPPWPEVRQFARQLLTDNARLTLQLTRQGQQVSQWPLAPDWALLAPSSITIQLEQNGDRLTARFVDPRPKLRYQRWHLLDQSILSVQVTLNEVLLDLSGPVDWRFPLPETPASNTAVPFVMTAPAGAEDSPPVGQRSPPTATVERTAPVKQPIAVKRPVAKSLKRPKSLNQPQTTAPK